MNMKEAVTQWPLEKPTPSSLESRYRNSYLTWNTSASPSTSAEKMRKVQLRSFVGSVRTKEMHNIQFLKPRERVVQSEMLRKNSTQNILKRKSSEPQPTAYRLRVSCRSFTQAAELEQPQSAERAAFLRSNTEKR